MPNYNNPNDQSDLSRFMKVVGDSLNEAATKVNDAIPEEWKKKGSEIGRNIAIRTEEAGDYIVKSSQAAFEHIKTIPDHLSEAYKSVSTSITDFYNEANQPKASSSSSNLEHASVLDRRARQVPHRLGSMPSGSLSARGGAGRRFVNEIRARNNRSSDRGRM